MTAESTPEFGRTGAPDDAFFFASGGAALCGIWRATESAKRVWVFCPPFAEEEKSARRTFTELADARRARGDASLIFSYFGTGDSGGDFAHATLSQWRTDIRAACVEAQRRLPDAEICLAGLRLGATLALEVAGEVGARRLVLMEPLLNGRAQLSALNQKKRLRAMVTKNDAASGGQALANDQADDDFDGWPLSAALRDELQSLDVTQPPAFTGATLVLQIGPRENLLPATEKWANALNAQKYALKMQAFWNLLDYARADALYATLGDW